MKPRILVAEDNPDLLPMLRAHFKHSPFDAEFVNTGLLASQMYHAAIRDGRPFDLLLLDHAMPMGLGLSVVQEIRDLGDWKTPVVLMTACTPREVKKDADRLKVCKIIYKPFADLIEPIKECLEKEKASHA